ncbi:MAG TPA: PstS family phosphate ABC transporter substrate-binding protein [Planctomycetaceae bacterium]|jgi:phosphate transport system substrate-binding protein|nr:PstS family phosphate ABC transporter substrate-binding protein [Planctomycetaceae bacterium]
MVCKDLPVLCFSPASHHWRRLLFAVLAVTFAGCSIRDAETAIATGTSIDSTSSDGTGSSHALLRGRIAVDGSSTVYPITQAAAEEFMKRHPKVAVPIGVAGTAGGFKRFVVDDLDVCDASRPIEPEEVDACRRNGVGYLELPIGIDGISVVVNPKNTWCNSLTVAQLKQLWESHSRIQNWNELDPAFPKQEIVLYGPDTDSGTFEYFTEVICGRRGNSRTDYTPSSNDNILIQGVEGDAGAIGYFGYAYYSLNRGSLRALSIVPTSDRIAAAGTAAPGVAPTDETILSGRYKPLSRPLFIYVNRKSLHRPEVAAFLTFYLEQAPSFVSEVHYIPLPAAKVAECRARLQHALQGE